MHYTITYHDGDTVSSRINATGSEIKELFQVGSIHNIGGGASDCYKEIVSVAISE